MVQGSSTGRLAWVLAGVLVGAAIWLLFHSLAAPARPERGQAATSDTSADSNSGDRPAMAQLPPETAVPDRVTRDSLVLAETSGAPVRRGEAGPGEGALLRGRVLHAEDGAPLSEATVALRVRYTEEPDRQVQTLGSTDAGGRFALPLRSRELASLQLDAKVMPHLWHSFTVDPVPVGLDLGDLLLPRTRVVRFQVLDARGRALPEAEVSTGPFFLREAVVLSGEDGSGTLNLWERPYTLHARKSGFAPAKQPVSATESDPVVLVLQPSTRLTIRLVDPKGEPVTLPAVEFETSDELFPGLEERDDAYAHTQRGSWQSGRWVPKLSMMGVRPDPEGIVELNGLSTSARIRVRVVHGAGDPYREELLPLLSPGEHLSRTWVLDVRGLAFSGRVLDADGKPIRRARIHLKVGGGSESRSADWKGRFRFEGLQADVVELRIQAEGYLTLVRKAYRILPEGEEAEFRLQPGSPLRVRVEDEAGNPVSATVAIAAEGYASELCHGAGADGWCRFSAVPQVLLEVQVYLAGGRYVQEHDPAIPELVITIPLPGALQVARSDGALEPGLRYRLDIRPVDGETLHRSYGMEEQVASGVWTVDQVLPGDYRVTLFAGKLHEDDQQPEWTAIGVERTVRVTAGETTKVTF